MPFWFLIPAVAGGGGGGGVALGGGLSLGAIFKGLLIGGTVIIGSALVIDLVDDYLDRPATESETDRIIDRAGETSKAERERLRGCRDCQWCQILIHAQGRLVGGSGGSTFTLGPYLVRNRTVFAREGIILLGATHAGLKDAIRGRNFKEIERMGVFARTAAFIQARPANGGLPMGEHRTGGNRTADGNFRYDINVMGTIPAFMS